MFLPMSCTSPLTVASTILPFDEAWSRPSFSCSMNGIRWATACFITRADFTTCGRNILPEPNRSPTTFMPSISGPSITASGRGALEPRFLDVGGDEIGDAVHQRVRQPLLHRPFAPGEIGLLLLLAVTAMALGEREQPLGRVGAAVEHDVLAGVAQLRIEIVVHRDLAGIDDAHIHAGGDGVIEEHRVHRLAHRLVAAEREREVRDAAGDMGVRQVLPDPARAPR